MQKTKGGYTQAIARLRKAHDSVREAIGEDIEPRLRELLHLEPTQDSTLVPVYRPHLLACCRWPARPLAQAPPTEVRAHVGAARQPHVARKIHRVVDTARRRGIQHADRPGARPRRRVLPEPPRASRRRCSPAARVVRSASQLLVETSASRRLEGACVGEREPRIRRRAAAARETRRLHASRMADGAPPARGRSGADESEEPRVPRHACRSTRRRAAIASRGCSSRRFTKEPSTTR